MKLNEQRMRYFYEAVRHGSIRSAADFMDVAPSAVSRQIAQLERETMIPLIERHRRGVKPTEAGERVLAYFRERLAREDTLISELEALQGLRGGHIRLAVGEGFVGDLVAGPLASFMDRYPDVELSANVVGTNEVIREVLEDEAHLGLVFHPPAEPRLRSHARKRQPISAVMAPDHALAGQTGPLTFQRVAQERIALTEISYGLRQIVREAERAEHLQIAPVLVTNSIAMLKQFARSGHGLALLPAFAVAREIHDGQLLAVEIDQPDLQRAEAHIVTRLGRRLSVGANRLLQHLLGTMTAFREDGNVKEAKEKSPSPGA